MMCCVVEEFLVACILKVMSSSCRLLDNIYWWG